MSPPEAPPSRLAGPGAAASRGRREDVADVLREIADHIRGGATARP